MRRQTNKSRKEPGKYGTIRRRLFLAFHVLRRVRRDVALNTREAKLNHRIYKWSEEETILAFYHYCTIPFGKLSKTNPEIIKIASILGRTPSSVVLKMCNLAHFDPDLKKRNISGMSNASKTDQKIVTDFWGDWEKLSFKAAQIEHTLVAKNTDIHGHAQTRLTGNDVMRLNKERVNQQFFREAVWVSYHGCCCITGVAVPELLIASHIKPWAISDPETERTNPRNGLCLNVLHDKAFDKGLITVLPDYTVRISSKLRKHIHSDSIPWLLQCDKQEIVKPEKFAPKQEFLQYHNDVIFIP